MSRCVGLVALLLLLAPLSFTTPGRSVGTARTWDGWITDDKCGAKGAGAHHKDCASKCSEKGARLVLYDIHDKMIYGLDKQDLAKEHIGHEVTVTGTAVGYKIAVESIEMKLGLSAS